MLTGELLSQAVSISIKSLITRVKEPSLRTLIGKVSNLTIGRISALTDPKMIARMIKLRALPLKLNPDSGMLVSQIAAALIGIRRLSFIIA